MKKIFDTILKYRIKEEDNGKTFERVIMREFPISRGLFTELKLNGKIKINDHVSRSIDKVYVDDIITADISENIVSEIPEYDINLEILYEDAHILVVNKPFNLSVHPCIGHYEKTLAGAVIKHWRNNKEEHNFHAVNRLDKDTSGLCIIAKNRYSHNILSKQHQNNYIKKNYIAVVHGQIKESGIIDKPIKRTCDSIIKREVSEDGKSAITEYTPINYNERYSIIEISLKTGRTHQIRLHMSYIGHPLYGDWLYGYGDKEKELIRRHALHSHKISFFHPYSGKKMNFSTDMPDDIKSLITSLDCGKKH